MSLFKVVFRDGHSQPYNNIHEAGRAYWNEVWNVEGKCIPEFYKVNEQGIVTHRFISMWTEIPQPNERAKELGTVIGQQMPIEDFPPGS